MLKTRYGDRRPAAGHQQSACLRIYRLGRPATVVRVAGSAVAVDLYELHAEEADSDWCARRDTYETALAEYEAGHWAACCRMIYPLLIEKEGHYDIPCLNLVSRALECLKSPPRIFDPIVDLSTK